MLLPGGIFALYLLYANLLSLKVSTLGTIFESSGSGHITSVSLTETVLNLEFRKCKVIQMQTGFVQVVKGCGSLVLKKLLA